MRETTDFSRTLTDHLCPHNNMSQQLSVIGIVIYRKCGNLFYLSDIMTHSRCQKQISLQNGVCGAIVITKFGHP